jgi:hypothetical protein
VSDTHTGPAAQKLVDAVQEDLGEIVDLLDRALVKIRAVEVAGKGVNGLAATMKAKGGEIGLTIDVLKGEAESVAKKMLHDPRKTPAIVQMVDESKVADVIAAKSKAS